jgi:hypothetical protein
MKHPHFLSFIRLGSLLQICTGVKKHNVVCVRIQCGLGSSVLEVSTASIFSRLSEGGGSMSSEQYRYQIMWCCQFRRTHFDCFLE